MQAWTVVLLGLGLAVDSTLVALALGLRAGDHRLRPALAVGASFGVVHGALTMLGGTIGANVAGWFASYDHWVAFAVLGALGVRSMLEGRGPERAPERLSALTVLGAAVATSLDGVAVGFGLELAAKPVGWVALSAAAATFAGSTASFLVGRGVPPRGRRAAYIVAGAVLIAIGASVLREHFAS